MQRPLEEGCLVYAHPVPNPTAHEALIGGKTYVLGRKELLPYPWEPCPGCRRMDQWWALQHTEYLACACHLTRIDGYDEDEEVEEEQEKVHAD